MDIPSHFFISGSGKEQCRNELSGFTKCGEFLDELIALYLLNKDSAALWS
jgi:hypothetical protein